MKETRLATLCYRAVYLINAYDRGELNKDEFSERWGVLRRKTIHEHENEQEKKA